MNVVDAILLAVLFLFGLRGYFKGLFRETFSLGGLAVGFMTAVRYNGAVAALLEGYWPVSPFVLKGTAFIGVFFVVYFLFNLMGWLLHRSAKALFLQTFNRTGGVAIGLGKGAAVMALALFFAGSAAWVPQSARDKFAASILAPPLSQLGEGMLRIGKEKILTEGRDHT